MTKISTLARKFDKAFNVYFEELMELVNTLNKANTKGETRDKTSIILEEMKEILSQMRITVHSVKNPSEKVNFMKLMHTYQDRLNVEESIIRIKSSGRNRESSLRLLNIAHAEILKCEESASSILDILYEQRATLRRIKKEPDDDLISKIGNWFRRLSPEPVNLEEPELTRINQNNQRNKSDLINLS